MRTCYPAQRTLFNALQWPKWKGNPKKRGHMYTYSRFSLLYCRNYHNIAKQLHSNKIFLKSRKKLAMLPMILGRCKNPELPLCLLMSLNTLYPEYTLFPAHFFFFFFFSFLTSWNPCLKGNIACCSFPKSWSASAHTLGESAADEKVDQPQARSSGSRVACIWPQARHLLKAPALSFFQLIILPLNSQDPLSKSASRSVQPRKLHQRRLSRRVSWEYVHLALWLC